MCCHAKCNKAQEWIDVLVGCTRNRGWICFGQIQWNNMEISCFIKWHFVINLTQTVHIPYQLFHKHYQTFKFLGFLTFFAVKLFCHQISTNPDFCYEFNI